MTEDISPPPATKNRRNIAVSPVVVEHNIKISNRFLHDIKAVIQIAKQCKTRSCHKPSLKGRFGGIVDIIEDSNSFSRSADTFECRPKVEQ